MKNPGWAIYAAIGALLFFANVVGLVLGSRNGDVTVTSDTDTPETRSNERWVWWQLFAGSFAQAVVWPLFVPIFLRQVRSALENGEAPTFRSEQIQDPVSVVPREEVNLVFQSLATWRTDQEKKFGDASVTLALVMGVVQEGRGVYSGASPRTARRLLVGHLKRVFDHIEMVRKKEISE